VGEVDKPGRWNSRLQEGRVNQPSTAPQRNTGFQQFIAKLREITKAL